MGRIGKNIWLLVILTYNPGRLIRRLWINVDTDLNTVLFELIKMQLQSLFQLFDYIVISIVRAMLKLT